MELKRASQFTVSELSQLWNRGYIGYFVPIQFTDAQMEGHIRISDLDLEHSVIAMDGDTPAAFSFLAVRGQRGWIGGVGVAPEYRGRGVASALFAGHTGVIRRETNLSHVQLEVFVQNWAQKVYERHGFATTRQLSLYEGTLPAGRRAPDVQSGAVFPLLAHSERLHGEWVPCWQREPAGLTKSLPPTAQALWTGPADAPTGYLIYNMREQGIGITDAAASDTATAATLLDGLAQAHPGVTVRIVNEPEGSPAAQALTALGCEETSAQYEQHWAVRQR
ncbi:MAG: Acetyltransferase, gnat family protein [Firmicutes bacterium]|nr:Acetyltransferase, gnat family protein [Bacillota bacterium]